MMRKTKIRNESEIPRPIRNRSLAKKDYRKSSVALEK